MTNDARSHLGFGERFAVFQCLLINPLNLPWLSVTDSYRNSSKVVRVFEHEVVHALQRVVSYLKEGEPEKRRSLKRVTFAVVVDHDLKASAAASTHSRVVITSISGSVPISSLVVGSTGLSGRVPSHEPHDSNSERRRFPLIGLSSICH